MSARHLSAAVTLALLGSLPVGADDDKLKALLRERLAALQQVQVEVEHIYRAGQASVDAVLQANAAALEAELDLCQSQKERLTVLEKAVEVARRAESYATTVAKAGQARPYEALK